MRKRLIVAAGLSAAGTGGILLAKAFTYPVSYETEYVKSYAYYLLFEPGAWIIPLSAFLGIFFRALSKNTEAELRFERGVVARHDEHVFFSHWAHALSVLILAVSGMILGTAFVPRLTHTPEATALALNLHFVGAVIFVSVLFYRISDLAIGRGVKDLLPAASDMGVSLSYYKSKLGMGSPPKQGKFLASEKLTFPLWLILVAGITITGGIKTAAHVWSLPSALMPKIAFLHDICAMCLLVLLVLHIILGAIVPWSWPLLRSMVTGHVAEEYVREHHVLWYEQIQREDKGPRSGKETIHG